MLAEIITEQQRPTTAVIERTETFLAEFSEQTLDYAAAFADPRVALLAADRGAGWPIVG
jgi:hypothetical protein